MTINANHNISILLEQFRRDFTDGVSKVHVELKEAYYNIFLCAQCSFNFFCHLITLLFVTEIIMISVI